MADSKFSPKTGPGYRRSFTLTREAINVENRTVELSFSSEAAYARSFGMEILGHKREEVQLDRLASGTHPLLLQHDLDKQIGVVEKAWLDEKEKKGRAIVRFAPPTNKLAEEVFQDVVAGIRSLVSVGYSVEKWERMCDGDEEDEDKKTIGFRAVSWTPFEISQVSIPADATVGIGRGADSEPPQDTPVTPVTITKEETATVTASTAPAVSIPSQINILTRGKTMPEDIKPAEQEMLEIERKAARERAEAEARAQQERIEWEKKAAKQRVGEIFALSERFKAYELREKAITENWSVERFRQEIMDRMNPDSVIAYNTPEDQAVANRGKSIGEIFVNSQQYREIGLRMANHSRDRFEITIPDRQSFNTRTTLIASSQLSSYLTSSQTLPGVPGLLDQQQLRVAQVFPTGTTTSRRISYVIEDGFSNAATGVAEDAQKQESSLNISEAYVDVMKVAVYTKVTEEMLADQEGIRSYIDNRLTYMVGAHEDDDLLNGTSAASEVTGVLQTSGIQTLVAGTYPTAIDAIGQAVGKVRNVGFVEPTAIIVNSQDWVDFNLTKDLSGQYLAGGPFWGQYGVGGYSNVGRMFGIPVVVTSFIAEGTALVGAFNVGAQIFRRSGIVIDMTNADSTDFQYNRITIRAESRMALAVFKPKAFCSVTGIA